MQIIMEHGEKKLKGIYQMLYLSIIIKEMINSQPCLNASKELQCHAHYLKFKSNGSFSQLIHQRRRKSMHHQSWCSDIIEQAQWPVNILSEMWGLHVSGDCFGGTTLSVSYVPRDFSNSKQGCSPVSSWKQFQGAQNDQQFKAKPFKVNRRTASNFHCFLNKLNFSNGIDKSDQGLWNLRTFKDNVKICTKTVLLGEYFI